ncbi:MAG: carboxypeptidase-like regulatory domain-containing protein, partial [Gemmatimonadota bacterium]|nr:carboxypeptidase-like regulatory domain-containing protein [Gemmatimonadota bacterium]
AQAKATVALRGDVLTRRVLSIAVLTAAAPYALGAFDGPLAPRLAQPSTLTVRVREDATQRPLPNADVVDLGSGTHRFTNDLGEARIVWPAGGSLRLRVRQLGFQMVERTVNRADGSPTADTITFALKRVPFVLPSVVTTGTDRCDEDVDSLARQLSVPALEHLRLGAERYEAFRRAYPFRIRQERRTITLDSVGKPRRVRQADERAWSEDWGESYHPGRIVHRTPLGFSVPILFLSALADPEFWERHCFVVRGVEPLGGRRVLRLEFTPARGVRGAEWAGAAFTDSATSLLRRVEFALAGLRPDDMPTRLEGYTTFTSPSPFIAIPESTVAVWWRRPPQRDSTWGMPDVVQLLRVIEVEYRRAKPPGLGEPQG